MITRVGSDFIVVRTRSPKNEITVMASAVESLAANPGQGYITLRLVSGATYHLDAEIYEVMRALKGSGEWTFDER